MDISSLAGQGEGGEGGLHSVHYREQRRRIVMIFFFRRRNLENYLSKI